LLRHGFETALSPDAMRRLSEDVSWLLWERARRCLADGEAVMSFSSRDIRAELLGMGHSENQVSEQDVRLVLRRVLEMARGR